MVFVSWLELGLTDAVVNFISVILWRQCYICLVQNVITETLFKGYLDLFIQLHVLAWADGFAFVTFLLCMLILDFMFGIQL